MDHPEKGFIKVKAVHIYSCYSFNQRYSSAGFGCERTWGDNHSRGFYCGESSRRQSNNECGRTCFDRSFHRAESSTHEWRDLIHFSRKGCGPIMDLTYVSVILAGSVAWNFSEDYTYSDNRQSVWRSRANRAYLDGRRKFSRGTDFSRIVLTKKKSSRLPNGLWRYVMLLCSEGACSPVGLIRCLEDNPVMIGGTLIPAKLPRKGDSQKQEKLLQIVVRSCRYKPLVNPGWPAAPSNRNCCHCSSPPLEQRKANSIPG